MKQTIRLTESKLRSIIKECVKKSLNEMGTPKQNALLQKLTGSNKYDNLSTRDASTMISDLLSKQPKRMATDKQKALIKKYNKNFTDDYLNQLDFDEASSMVSNIVNKKGKYRNQSRYHDSDYFLNDILNNSLILTDINDDDVEYADQINMVDNAYAEFANKFNDEDMDSDDAFEKLDFTNSTASTSGNLKSNEFYVKKIFENMSPINCSILYRVTLNGVSSNHGMKHKLKVYNNNKAYLINNNDTILNCRIVHSGHCIMPMNENAKIYFKQFQGHRMMFWTNMRSDEDFLNGINTFWNQFFG